MTGTESEKKKENTAVTVEENKAFFRPFREPGKPSVSGIQGGRTYGGNGVAYTRTR